MLQDLQHRAGRLQFAGPHLLAGPLVVQATADHELDLVVMTQVLEIGPQIAVRLARVRRLDVDDTHHPGVHRMSVDRAAGLQRNLVAVIAQPFQQRQTAPLRQGFSTGDTDEPSFELCDLVADSVDGMPLPATERVRGIAVAAAQGTAGQANEDGWKSDATAFTLQRVKDLGQPQTRLA